MPTPSTTSAVSRGFPLVVLAALCWGTSGVSARIVTDRTDLGPLDIAWHRMAVGAAVLLAGYLLTRHRRPSSAVPLTRPLAVRLGLVGAGLAAYQLAFFAAVEEAGVSVSTLVALGLAPLLIALGAAALGHGRPDRATLVTLALALVGLGLLVGLTAGASAGTAVLLGALLASGSALGYAVVTLAGGGVPAGVPVTLTGFVGGALLLTPVALAAGLRLTTEPVALATLLYLGVVPSAVAYALFFRGLQTVPGAVAGIVTLLEPVTATALATVVLGERLPLGALAGGVLVLAAVAGLYLRRPAVAEAEAVAEAVAEHEALVEPHG
ncbi:MAG TPA: EamA family transporter [Geodermatophilus sp.]|nr:EamA family transporter [Geodermatophilus sp.]